MALPILNDLTSMETTWSSVLNPVINLPLNQGTLLKAVPLVSGSNTINHTLGRKLQGWFITRMRGSFVQVYDTQDSNQMPALTLLLHASGPVVADLFVF
jgi:hypothetical protein